ncbi:MAG: DinB family protein [Acidobacteria bacterium]|nr:DinB family protein [Acidobacteriota bacterium]
MTPLAGLLLAFAQAAPAEGLGRVWAGDFEVAARQLVALAEATPADKFSFRPAPGVRSTSEVCMHVAVGKHWLLAQAGVKPGGAHWPNRISMDAEKTVTAKADVVKWLKDSLAAVRASYASVDKQRIVKFLGADVPAENVLLRILVHNHEHMGQAIGYARTSGVTPPWSKGGGAEK